MNFMIKNAFLILGSCVNLKRIIRLFEKLNFHANIFDDTEIESIYKLNFFAIVTLYSFSFVINALLQYNPIILGHSIIFAITIFGYLLRNVAVKKYILVLIFFAVGMANTIFFAGVGLGQNAYFLSLVLAFMFIGLKFSLLLVALIAMLNIHFLIFPNENLINLQKIASNFSPQQVILSIIGLLWFFINFSWLMYKFYKRIKLAEENSNMIIDSINDSFECFVIFDKQDKIFHRNASWIELNKGIKGSTNVGVSFEDHLKAGIRAGLMPDSFGREDEWLKERMFKHVNADGTSYLVRRQNNKVISTRERRLDNGFIALNITDVTEIVKEKELRNLVGILTESLRTSAVICDKDGKIIWVNKSFERQTGYELDEISGKKPGKFLQGGNTSQDSINRLSKAIKSGKYIKENIVNYKKSGESFVNSISLSTIIQGGNKYIFSLQDDVTDSIKNMEVEIQKEKLVTMGKMASNISHEITQPLNAIRIGMRNIRRQFEKTHRFDEIDLEALKERFIRIDGQVERAANIINHMRQFGRKDVEKQPFDSVIVVSNVYDFIKESCRLMQINLSVNLPEKQIMVMGKWILLEQVMLNLTKNAQDQMDKFNEKNDKNLSLSIHLSDEDEVIITVSDTGGGIPENELEGVFEAYFTTKDENEGTGLGLSISRKIIEEMNGSITARNDGQGAIFTITLPHA